MGVGTAGVDAKTPGCGAGVETPGRISLGPEGAAAPAGAEGAAPVAGAAGLLNPSFSRIVLKMLMEIPF